MHRARFNSGRSMGSRAFRAGGPENSGECFQPNRCTGTCNREFSSASGRAVMLADAGRSKSQRARNPTRVGRSTFPTESFRSIAQTRGSVVIGKSGNVQRDAGESQGTSFDRICLISRTERRSETPIARSEAIFSPLVYVCVRARIIDVIIMRVIDTYPPRRVGNLSRSLGRGGNANRVCIRARTQDVISLSWLRR